MSVHLENQELEALARRALGQDHANPVVVQLATNVLRLMQEHNEYVERVTKLLHESQDQCIRALTLAAENLQWKDRASAWQEQEMMSPELARLEAARERVIDEAKKCRWHTGEDSTYRMRLAVDELEEAEEALKP